jgi:GT2 family glycosyltransferase
MPRIALASTRLDSFEVIVADNASTDGTVEMLVDRFPGCRSSPLPRTSVSAGPATSAGTKAKSSLVLFLNSDTVVSDRALDRLVELARAPRGRGHRAAPAVSRW